jgi:hypothetical protein
MTRAIANELKRIALRGEIEPEGLLRRAFRRLRMPRRAKPNIEQMAARHRVESLFEVNFRTTWTR